MALAARLNLRMQKELKLLITDPPPGASFPSLCDDSSASSLTSIDAHVQGPEGTVYAQGVFKIKIQIPERYPFQPPIVSFATPIYHPNIDNGGRICLDILNLPPKGTWQPSLNISTVLTSIGLLLSEPNPDDGLMHEASREYKYNRQAFDQKAISMTEKYARAGESESASGSHGSQTHKGPNTAQPEVAGSDASICATEHFVYHERFGGSSRKLSLESLASSSNWDSGKGICKVPIHGYSKNHIEIGRLKNAKQVAIEYNGSPDKLQATRNKLSLKVSVVSHTRNGERANIDPPNQCMSLMETQITDSPEASPLVQVDHNHELVSHKDEDNRETSHSISVSQEQQSLHYVKTSQSRDSNGKLHHMPQHAVSQLESTRPHKALSLSLSTSHNKTNPYKDVARNGSGSTSIRPKKADLVGSSHQHHLKDEKENLAPFSCLPPQLTKQSAASTVISSVCSKNGIYYNEKTVKQAVAAAPKLSEMAAELPLKPLGQQLGSNNNMILHSENPSSPHSKFLHTTDDVRSNEKQQTKQVHNGESIGKFKQLTGGLSVPEAVIVLDSEDSDDENVPVRSKLSLAKRCLSKKRKYAIQ